MEEKKVLKFSLKYYIINKVIPGFIIYTICSLALTSMIMQRINKPLEIFIFFIFIFVITQLRNIVNDMKKYKNSYIEIFEDTIKIHKDVDIYLSEISEIRQGPNCIIALGKVSILDQSNGNTIKEKDDEFSTQKIDPYYENWNEFKNILLNKYGGVTNDR